MGPPHGFIYSVAWSPVGNAGSLVPASFIKKIGAVQTQMASIITGGNTRQAQSVLLGELGWPSMRLRYLLAALQYWGRVWLMPKDRPVRIILV